MIKINQSVEIYASAAEIIKRFVLQKRKREKAEEEHRKEEDVE